MKINRLTLMLQVFVESLDRCFENVCELDLVSFSNLIYS